MAQSLPWDDGRDDRRGWDRASIANRSTKPYKPGVSQRDLLLPSAANRFRALALCAVCAFAMTVLYVLVPLYILGVFLEVRPFAAEVLLAAFAGLTALLYYVSVREDRELQALAREL
jgi:hypothetical protein